MNEKEKFGQLTSEEFSIGDIVQWATWDKVLEQWNDNYLIYTFDGFLVEIDKEEVFFSEFD